MQERGGVCSSVLALVTLKDAALLPQADITYVLSLSAETPLSLSQLCRVSLRRAAGVRGLEKIARLDIPPRLIDFLSYN